MRQWIIGFALVLSACSLNPSDEITGKAEEANQNNAEKTKELQKQPETLSVEPPEVVKIIEFFDYGCGHCRNAHEITVNLKEKFGEKIEIIEKHFPLSPATFLVAETAECARTQGKFNEYHDTLFLNYFGNYQPENLQKAAESVELDMDEFNACATSGSEKGVVEADRKFGESLGVKGTPFFLINDSIPVPGAIPEQSFERLIQQVLDGEVS